MIEIVKCKKKISRIVYIIQLELLDSFHLKEEN